MTAQRASIKEWLGFIRWPNLAMIALFLTVIDRAVIGVFLDAADIRSELSVWSKVLLILDVVLVTVVGYALNDLFDRNVDEVNRPKRLLVRYPSSESKVRALILILLLIGFAMTIFLGYVEERLAWVWLYPGVVVLLLLYAREGKRWGIFGNALVSLLIAALPLIWVIAESDALVALGQHSPTLFHALLHLLGAYLGLMFFSNLGREIVKDVQDLNGDQEVGSKSLATRLSLGGIKVVMIADLVLIGATEYLLWTVMPRSIALSGFAVLVLIILLILYRWVMKLDHDSGAARLSTGYKWLMLLGILQLIALPLTLL